MKFEGTNRLLLLAVIAILMAGASIAIFGAQASGGGGGGAGNITAVGDAWTETVFTADGAGNRLWFEGSTADNFETQLTAADPGADYTATLPAATGEISLLGQLIAEAELDIDNTPVDEYVLTYEVGTGKLHWQAETGATLTQEEVEDYIGGIINDGDSIQTRITVTYDDADNALDFIVDDLDSTLTQEEVEDFIGEIINDGDSVQTRITVTYNDSTNSLDFVVDDLGATLTQEEVDDYVSLLINDSDSVHTRIAITYDDVDNAYDFVVDNDLSNYSFASVTSAILEQALKCVNVAVDEDILTYEFTTGDFEWHTPAELITAGTNLSWNGTTLDATDTFLSQEDVEDYIGTIINDAESVQTRITVTYDDTDNALDFIVDDLDSTLTQEEVEDFIGGVINDGDSVQTRITVTYNDSTDSLDFVVDDLGATLTQEQVDDYVALLINDGDSVHTRITITYDDANNAYDFVVDNDLSNYSFASVTNAILEQALKAVNAADDEDILTYETTTGDFEWHVPSELITAGDNLAWTGTTLNATNTHLVQEDVDDFVAALINDAESTHTRITITYDDTDDAYDFVVDNMTEDVFKTHDTPLGTDPVADSSADILTLTNTDTYIDITGNEGTDTIDFTLDSAVTLDAEWNTEGEVETVWGSVNIILATEIDTEGELESLLGDVTDVFTNNDLIPEANLDIDNGPVDEYVLTYETATGKLHWQIEGGGASQLSDLTDVGTVNYTSGNVLVADGADYDSGQLAHSQLNNDETSIHLGTDTVKDGHIDWGVGANQISASDVPDEDVGDITITSGDWAVEDESHAHTTTSISGLDVSEDLNLIGGTGITLTDDTLSADLGDSIDISDETNLVAGTNISLSDDTLNVDDAFLLDTGDVGTGDYDFTGAVLLGATPLVFEGLTANEFETSFAIADPSEDRTITFPNVGGEVTLLGQDIDISDETNLVGGSGITLTDDTLSADLGTSIDASEIETGAVADDEIDYTAVTLADFDYQTAWRVFYSDSAGDVTELALGSTGQYLKSGGVSSAPTWDTPSGSGDITDVGDVGSDAAFTADGGGTQLWFEGSTADTYEIILTSADPSGSDFTVTLPAVTGTVLLSQQMDTETELEGLLTDVSDVYTDNDNIYIFKTVAAPSGTNPVADSLTDTLTLVAGSNITITGDESADSITIAATGGSGDITAVGDVSSDAAFTSDGTAGTSLWFYDEHGRGQLTIADLTDVRTYTLPNATGEISLLGQEVDISDETNLIGGTGITLTDDTLACDLGTSVGSAEIEADAVNDTHIDWGTGTNQVSASDMPNEDIGDITITGGDWAVEDESHAHTTTSISGLDVSEDLNLIGGTGITLTDDTLSCDLGDSIDISGETNLTAGDHITLTDDDLDVDDDFLLNDGDTGTGDYDFTGAVLLGASPLVFEGLTADEYETTFTITDPDADRTITFPNAAGEVSLLGQAIDISDETNLAVADPVSKTGDTIGLNYDASLTLSGSDLQVVDDGHSHTGTSLSGIDISDDTNLVAGTNITLDDDTLNVTDAWWNALGEISLTSSYVIVGSVGGVASAVDMTGDVDISNTGVTSIGSDKILEAMLKAVDAAGDEDILTRETTTGDFEWHTPSELITAGDNLTWDGTTLDAAAQLTQEEVDDYVAALINDAESVHTRITITYDDTDDAYDFVVDDMADDMGDVDTEAELESALTGTTNVFTEDDTDMVTIAMFADGDWGDMTVATNDVSLDAGVVDSAEIATNAVGDDEIDYSAVTLADFDYQTAWRVFYSDNLGDVTEFALGSTGEYLKSTGTTSAPEWDTPGDITAIGNVATGEAFTSDGTQGTSLWFYDLQGRGELKIADLSGIQTYTLPDATGEISLLGQSIDISDETNLTAGDHITLNDDDLDVSDDWWDDLGDITLTSSYIIVGSSGNVASAADMTGDIDISNTGITSIGSDKILEAMLKVTGAASADEDILTRETTTGDFEWHTPSELITAGTDITWVGTTLNVDDSFLANDGDVGSGDYDLTGAVLLGSTPLVFEGATPNDYETSFAITDPTADRTITLPDATGEVSLLGQSIDISDETNLVEGEGIDLTDDTVSGEDASTTNKGIASFDSGDFDASSGAVSLANINYQISGTAGGATVPSSGGAEKVQVEGTNFSYFTLKFNASTDESAYWNNFDVPDTYTGGDVTAVIKWTASATSGAVVWNLQTLGVNDSEQYDQALGSAQSVTTTVDATANDMNESSISSFSPGWAAGDVAVFGLTRDADNGSDTMSGNAEVLEVNISWPSER